MPKTKKPKAWTHPYKDYKYRTGNEGRHHKGLVHYGYAQRDQEPRGYNHRKPPADVEQAA